MLKNRLLESTMIIIYNKNWWYIWWMNYL
jgi:hypothetical protein